MPRPSSAALTALCSIIVVAVLGPTRATQAVERKRWNVLFIGVDDLRPELGSYGSPDAKTPHLDALATRAVVFQNTYAQQAICGASRASMLTGTRPDTTGVLALDYPESFRTSFIAAHPSLPRFFFNAGYWAQTMGKIHQGTPLDTAQLSTGHGFPTGKTWAIAGNEQARPPVEAADVADAVYWDGALTEMAITSMRTAKASSKPFFLAVGYQRPHLPFACPKRYFDMYDAAKLALSAAPTLPAGAPQYAAASFELPQYDWNVTINPLMPIPEAEARRLRHGYLACVSFIDAQVGRLLAALSAEGLQDETIVVVWGDHGFHLGDQGAWGKHMNYEQATRAPLLLSVPGAAGNGKRAPGLVELVDIFPTLAELVDVERPAYLEGKSLAPLLDDPTQPWKSAVFSQFPRGTIDGRAVRTNRWRYIEWRQSDRVIARELYDLATDALEVRNVATVAANATVVAELGKTLADGWRAVRIDTPPPGTGGASGAGGSGGAAGRGGTGGQPDQSGSAGSGEEPNGGAGGDPAETGGMAGSVPSDGAGGIAGAAEPDDEEEDDETPPAKATRSGCSTVPGSTETDYESAALLLMALIALCRRRFAPKPHLH